MRLPFFPLSPEGRRLLAKEAVCGFAAGTALKLALPSLILPAAALFVSAAVFTLFFFREPRFLPLEPEPGVILSPSYGTVLRTAVENGEPVVRIFLSVLDAHAQYSPVEGEVRSVTVSGGTYEPAFREAAAANRRNLIEIAMRDGGALRIEQIAGSIARMISCPLKAGDPLRPGSRLGLIYFGSQVAVYLPRGAEILVKPGDKMLPCRSVLARAGKTV